jgi:hypothetical protein
MTSTSLEDIEPKKKKRKHAVPVTAPLAEAAAGLPN